MKQKLCDTFFGRITASGDWGSWQLFAKKETSDTGIELIHLDLHSPELADPPKISVEWNTPQVDMTARWSPDSRFSRNIPPNWAPALSSMLAVSIPLVQIINSKGENRMLIAVSDAMRKVDIKCGVMEENNEIQTIISLFSEPEAPIDHCSLTIRLDSRKIFYADAIRSAMDWFAGFPEYTPSPVPEAAFEPIYSSWYSYHQNVFAAPVKAECELAREYGMKGIILDDGWQTDDNQRGYAFCGDWEVSKNRFSDMRGHVAAVHRLGMKYLVWFGVPLTGEKSKTYSRFKSKTLYSLPHRNVSILDPRFPEVREFLISIYENALKEWDIDGFKLDFIDLFRFDGEDPAVKGNYAGRDIRSLPEAVDRLLSNALIRLKALKPDILIEFRQRYIGPAIRKYGNMFRSSDCPGDALSNRVNTLDLRLTSGNAAVHSDMLEWNINDTAENAALQFLNILFSVPQISVKLGEIPKTHSRMLHFWLDFWMRHRDVLLHGTLRPYHPELNYPVVSAKNAKEKIIAVYHTGQYVGIDCGPGKTCYIVNASGESELILDLHTRPEVAEYFETTGHRVLGPVPRTGFSRVAVPSSGLIKLKF